MKVDGGIPADLSKAAQAAKEVEAAGYSGAWTAETAHDPFLPLAVAAEHTDTLELGTSIAVAFARNPMLLAKALAQLDQLDPALKQQVREGRAEYKAGKLTEDLDTFLTRLTSKPKKRSKR